MNHREKQFIMNENRLMCNHGILKNIPVYKTQKYKYNSELTIPTNSTFCVVEVMSADIITVGQKFSTTKNTKPVIVIHVDKQFNGSNLDNLNNVTNDDFILRSNYYKTMNVNNLYPLNDGEITFNQTVLIFRDEKYEVTPNQKYGIPVITFSPIKQPVLLGAYMRPDDYLGYQESIEAIFQGACIAGCDTLILSDMGCSSYGIPPNEAIEILNICILKYCTLFKFIIFAIPVRSPSDMNLIAMLTNGLVKPQSLTNTSEPAQTTHNTDTNSNSNVYA